MAGIRTTTETHLLLHQQRRPRKERYLIERAGWSTQVRALDCTKELAGYQGVSHEPEIDESDVQLQMVVVIEPTLFVNPVLVIPLALEPERLPEPRRAHPPRTLESLAMADSG